MIYYFKIITIAALLFVVPATTTTFGARAPKPRTSNKKNKRGKRSRDDRCEAVCPCFTKNQIELLEGDPDCQIFEEGSVIEFLDGSSSAQEIIGDVCTGPRCLDAGVRQCFFALSVGDDDFVYISRRAREITKKEDRACRAIIADYCEDV